MLANKSKQQALQSSLKNLPVNSSEVSVLF